MPDFAKCSSCGRTIVWATSPSGARLPLDARHLTLYYLDTASPPNAIAVTPEVIRRRPDMFSEETTETPHVYVSHFVTCPQAAEHSRSRK